MNATHSHDDLNVGSHASSGLLQAAVAGLMGLTAMSCGTKEKEKIITVVESQGVVTSTIVKAYTLSDFQTYCKDRGGIVQLHASCGGANSCKGASWSFGKLKEHTCKGANSCAGMSCVDLAQDQGRTGEQILKDEGSGAMGEGPHCTYCHGAGTSEFSLPVAPGTDEAAAKAAFAAKTDAALVSATAFGLHGIKSNGTAFANMPDFYKTYSRQEIEKVVTYLRSLPLTVKAWEDPQ